MDQCPLGGEKNDDSLCSEGVCNGCYDEYINQGESYA